MSRPVRFLHVADVHLGTPLQGFFDAPSHIESQLMEASFEAWRRVCDAALAYDVDCVLVAGDLYHREARSVKAARCVQEGVERLARAGIGVYVVYGNHDPLGEGEELMDMPDNFHAFSAVKPGFIEIRDESDMLLARIHGISYRSRGDSRALHTMLQPSDGGVVNIGLLHTQLDPNNPNYCPCSVGDLVNQKHIHYWALGHIHQPRIVRYEQPTVAFPGTPQGRHPKEKGVGGCLLVELALGKAPDIQFVPISPLVWKEIEVSIDDHGDEAILTISDVERLLRARAEELWEGPSSLTSVAGVPLADTSWKPEGYLVRWVLTGRGIVHDALVNPENDHSDLLRSIERLQYRKPFLWTESVQMQTGRPLPEWQDAVTSWPLARKLDDIVESILSGELEGELAEAMGRIWDMDYDPEHLGDDTLPATPEVVRTIVKRARQLAYEKLLEGGGLS
ncbi:MAG: DNA repair exonuclease [Firmicutes bacterium]|nr:DNA repair exonuclease [Bacillota bacterium]